MPVQHFGSVQEALQGANDRIDIALERVMRYEATFDVHFALLATLIENHPDPAAVRESWQRLSSIALGNSAIHPGNDVALAAKADETQAQVRMISEMLDRAAGEDKEQ